MMPLDGEEFEKLVNSGKFVPEEPSVLGNLATRPLGNYPVNQSLQLPQPQSSSSPILSQSLVITSTNDALSSVVDSVTPSTSKVEKEEKVEEQKVKQTRVYSGDIIDNDPVPEGGWQTMNFPTPGHVLAFFNDDIRTGTVSLHRWQAEELKGFAVDPKPTSLKPFKYYLVAANGSGKDAFIITPFCIWFMLSKVRARVILTSSSGTQLTAQTETYIRNFAELVNQKCGQPIFKIRQRYIKCNLSGSEIRMFATDEAGKAEGYHPLEPNAEMAIIKNESKSIDEDIHRALKRCTGYNYWLEISSPGKPQGAFYQSVTDNRLRFQGRKVTSYECPHISEEEREDDKITLGEFSAEYRSKHLALFTFVDGESVIPTRVYEKCTKTFPTFTFPTWEKRIGVDIAAGGDETVCCCTQGNQVVEEYWFTDKDVVLTANKVEGFFLKHGISKDHRYIYMDDGGVGHGVVDILANRGWKVNRILNQSSAWNKKMYGNKGAECWFRVKRILEECQFDIRRLSQKTRDQLVARKYKQSTNGKLYLQAKREAKAEGFESPDRGDAFVLSLTELTINNFLEESVKKEVLARPRFTTEQVPTMYEDITFKDFNKPKSESSGKKAKGSLQVAMGFEPEDLQQTDKWYGQEYNN